MDEEKRLISDFSHSELQTIGTTEVVNGLMLQFFKSNV
jgi:hypothetical protein